MKGIFYYLFILILLISVSYGFWKIQKTFNYNFEYKSNVVNTIKETVKEECLK